MQAKVQSTDTGCCDREFNEELIGVLQAISVVSKRLAKKLAVMDAGLTEEGGNEDA